MYSARQSSGPDRMTGTRSIRGDVNAILNRLVGEGIITGFETNFDSPLATALALHIKVTADLITDPRIPGYDDKAVRAIRNRIPKDIKPLSTGVVVSIRQTPAKT